MTDDDLPPRTGRLVIRRWRHEDAARLLDIQSRYDVMKWLGDGEPVLMETLEQAHAKVEVYRERCAVPPLGYWAIERPDGVVAGSVALMVLPNAEDGEVEIGWHLPTRTRGARATRARRPPPCSPTGSPAASRRSSRSVTRTTRPRRR